MSDRICGKIVGAWIIGITLAISPIAKSVQIADIVRLKEAVPNKLVGMGLVVGLNGTGDGGKFLPATRPLSQMIARMVGSGVSPSELKDSRNVALVSVAAKISPRVEAGDEVDVYVASVGSAKSLRGGRLFMAPLTGPIPDSPVYAFAEGDVVVEDDKNPTAGCVYRGACLTESVRANSLDEHGQITLVINDVNASWSVASMLASQINGVMAPDGPRIAKALDPKNVVVKVPAYQQDNLAEFISNIEQTYLDPEFIFNGARVTINRRTGTIVISGNVQISPTIVSHKGLEITTITPPPQPTNFDPLVRQEEFLRMDPEGRGGAQLTDLLNAFNQLKVAAPDRIEILKLMHRSGALHAQLVFE